MHASLLGTNLAFTKNVAISIKSCFFVVIPSRDQYLGYMGGIIAR